jgi:hypothetical protein
MVGSASNEPPRAAPAAALVTVVESEACHFCADAHRALVALAVDFPLVVDTVDIRSTAGHDLVARHRAAMSPLVLIDGAFFSHGRLPRRKLAKLLDQRFGAPIARPTRSGGTHG